MTPEASVGLTTLEIRLSGGLLALSRLLTLFQSKQMPVAGFTAGRDGGGGMRATLLLDCKPEAARRHAALLEGLEDVSEIQTAEESIEVALLAGGGGSQESAEQHSVEAHESGGTLVASGEPERIEGWLAGTQNGDVVRLGPVARPRRNGGG